MSHDSSGASGPPEDSATSTIEVLESQGSVSLIEVTTHTEHADAALVTLTLPDGAEFVTAPPPDSRCDHQDDLVMVCEVPTDVSLFLTVQNITTAPGVTGEVCATGPQGEQVCTTDTQEPPLPEVTAEPLAAGVAILLLAAVGRRATQRLARSARNR